ncbi:MAG: cytochrome c [Acidobacteriia bacterium]|nr:cytochrome c [Terriglobia bacterium]
MKWKGMLVLLAIAALAIQCSCRGKNSASPTDPTINAYDVERDWTNPDHLIPLSFEQSQGKRVFYERCVWCHAETTPAGPSNRSNVSPTPSLINDGSILNPLSDEFLRNIITLGGSAMGRSAMMPPWGRTLSQEEIHGVIAYIRAVAQPPYHPPARPASQYSVKQTSKEEGSTK